MKAGLPPNRWGHRGRLRVGLLGGSFNPAHDGHRHISLTALRALGLDQVWWLVSPQNPLKSKSDMMPLAKRLAHARNTARHPRIRVSALEADLGTRFTADTLAMLRRRFPRMRFVWLMGADNLTDIRRWRRWRQIFRQAPIAVFDRSPYSYRALAGLAAHYWWWARRPAPRAKALADGLAPAWMYLHQRPHSASATAIRASMKTAAKSAGRQNKRKDSGHKVA